MSKETVVTIVGNVVNPPQRNRTANGSVTKFRVASTAQRYDKDVQGWVDKRPLYLDVECWGDLGGNVSYTLSKGDPVIVHGEMYTDEWESDQGRRSKVTLRASAVGPDLTRGTADFRRTIRPAASAEQPAAAPGEPPEDTAEFLAGAGPDGDYSPGAAALYEMDSDDSVPEPALH